MTKELFIKIIDNIKKDNERKDRISKILEEDLFDSWIIFKPSFMEENIRLLLIDVFGEEGEDTISWWLYENVEKKIWVDKKEYNVESIEDLYDFMEMFYLNDKEKKDEPKSN